MLRRGSETSIFSQILKHLVSGSEQDTSVEVQPNEQQNQTLKRHQEALRGLVTNNTIYSGNLDEALKLITKEMAISIEVERVSVWLFDPDHSRIRCLVQYNASSDDYNHGRIISADECPAYFASMERSRIAAIQDVHQDPRTAHFTHFETENIASMLDAPVYLDGKLVGVLSCVQLDTKRGWRNDEQKFVASAADMVALAFEVTERKRVERELRESRQLLRTVLDTAPSLIWVKDRNGRITMANQAFADLRGIRVDELEGSNSNEYLSKEQAARFNEDDRQVLDSLEEKFIPQESVTDSEGNERWLQTIKRPLSVPGTDDPHVLGVAIDITDRKRLENQLRQSQKIEAIGQLAGGIAHDFNNLLNGVLGYSGLLKHRYGGDPEISKIADRIEQAGQRAQQLTEKLIGFARQGKHQNVPVDVHAAVDETLALLQRTIETNVAIIPEFHAEQTHALGDPVQVQQIILNLAINARDAMSPDTGGTDGGTLRIGTNVVSVDTTTPDIGLELAAGEYLELTVSDTGCGISQEVRAKIFDPFFTTKRKGKGTGMGLSMVFGIVKNHGGTIRVRSEVGVGTTFLVYLPAVQVTDDGMIDQKSNSTSISGKGSILLVDDDEVTREVSTDMLETLGYQVVTANDGSEAVEYYRQHYTSVDAVILDMVMPKMGGRECFRACKQINPQVKAILTTGYDNNHSVQSVLNEGMIGFVQKPYSLERLSEEVARALSDELALSKRGYQSREKSSRKVNE